MGVSIALTDETIHASSPVRRRRERGSSWFEPSSRRACQVLVAPILPMITDSDDQIDALLAQIAAAGPPARPYSRCICVRALGVVHALPRQPSP